MLKFITFSTHTPAEVCSDYTPHICIGEVAAYAWRSPVFVHGRTNASSRDAREGSSFRSFAPRLCVSLT